MSLSAANNLSHGFRPPRDLARYALEDEEVEAYELRPVKEPPNVLRMPICRFDQPCMAIGKRLDLEFEHPGAGALHADTEREPALGFQADHGPVVEGVAHMRLELEQLEGKSQPCRALKVLEPIAVAVRRADTIEADSARGLQLRHLEDRFRFMSAVDADLSCAAADWHRAVRQRLQLYHLRGPAPNSWPRIQAR